MRKEAAAMAKRKRLTKITAGRYVEMVLYDQAMPDDSPKARAAKSKVSSAARQKINRRTCWQKCELALAANFDADDLFITFTYRDAPPTREAAVRMLGEFLRRLRESRAGRGERLIYIKNAEHLRDDGSEGRWHHHVVINATGRDFVEIRELWSSWGDNVDFERLLDGRESYASRAQYLCKEKPPVGRQTWTPSRGLRKPKRESSLVDESVTLTVDSLPLGATVLEKSEELNEWGHYVYLKYLLPRRPSGPDPRRPRGDGSPLFSDLG